LIHLHRLAERVPALRDAVERQFDRVFAPVANAILDALDWKGPHRHQPVLKNIQALLGKYIYGYDQQNLFAVLRDLLVSQDSNIVFKISPKLNKLDNILTQLQTEVAENLVKNQYNNTNRKYIKMDITFHDIDEKTRLTVSLDGGPKNNVEDFTFSNDISVFDEWVFNQTMGSLYKLLK